MQDRPFSRGATSTPPNNGTRPLTSRGDQQRPSTRMSAVSSDSKTNAMNLSRAATSRPMTGRNIGSALRKAPGTASRLTSARQRPVSRSGLTSSLGFHTPINIVDRPITQQGLSGLKSASSRSPQLQRQIQDKSYYMGLLRTKNAALSNEIARLNSESEVLKKDHASFLTYDKQVKEVAKDLTDLQGTLADYNTLVDLASTDTEQSEITEDIRELEQENRQKMTKLNEIFTKKQESEERMRELETEIEKERHLGDSMIESMSPNQRVKFFDLRSKNENFVQSLDLAQQRLDKLELQKKNLYDEISSSKVKLEAVEKLERLNELEVKKRDMVLENEKKGTPQQERDILVQQVKENNSEIATMERKISEIQDEKNRVDEEIQQLEMVIEENRSERGQKYRELRKREEMIIDFMATFDQLKEEEEGKIEEVGNTVVELLEKISNNLNYYGHLPSASEFSTIKSDIDLKKDELRKSQFTETTVKSEQLNLQANLQRIEALEARVEKEKEEIEKKLEVMKEELAVFSDITGLRQRMEKKRLSLVEEKNDFEIKKRESEIQLKKVSTENAAVKKALSENEAHKQLENLQKKWTQLEQNNFALREFIAQKRAETNFLPLKNKAMKIIGDYNVALQEVYQHAKSLPQ